MNQSSRSLAPLSTLLAAVMITSACGTELDTDGTDVDLQAAADSGELDETDEAVNPSGLEQALTVPACGTVLQSFDGTDAKSNGRYTGTGTACAGTGGIAGALQYQCVELVMRHFKRKWNLRWYGNAKTLLNGAPRSTVDVYRNGDAAHPPVPGDMVVWETGTWGHVALVTAVGRDYVDIIEQNVSNSNGKARLPFANGRIGARWGSWVPAGWAHAKANTATGGGGGGGGNDGGSCGSVGRTGGTIDDDHACFDVGGNPAWLRAQSGQGYGDDLIWTHAIASDDVDNSVTWRIDMAKAGRYRVEAFVDADVATSRAAHYRIRHNGVVDTADVDQSAQSGWTSLGEFQFAAGGNQRVYLADNTGERSSLQRKLVFDAVRLTPVCAQLKVATQNGTTLNVRTDRNASSRKLGELSSGAVVTRLNTRDGQRVEHTSAWHKVQEGNLEGWVAGA